MTETTDSRPSVLYVCVHNAGRSQMAAAYTRHLSGGAVEVRSAGSAPADEVNPAVREALLEEGIDISAETPKVLTDDAVLTMPPAPHSYVGPDAIAGFLRASFGARGVLTAAPTQVNGQPAYALSDGERSHGLLALAQDGRRIGAMTRFLP